MNVLEASHMCAAHFEARSSPRTQKGEGRRRACDSGPRALLASLLLLHRSDRACRANSSARRSRSPLPCACLPPPTRSSKLGRRIGRWRPGRLDARALPPLEPARIPFRGPPPSRVCVAREVEEDAPHACPRGRVHAGRNPLPSAALFKGEGEECGHASLCSSRTCSAPRRDTSFGKNATVEST